MIKHIEAIALYNKQRGFLDKGFNIDLENSFLLSEELETICHNGLALDLGLGIKHHDEFAKELIEVYKTVYDSEEDSLIAYVDKVIDHFYFGIGGMLQIGLNPTQIERLFEIVEMSNSSKSKDNKDGKNIKGDNFIDPKEEIRNVIRNIQK